MNMLRNQNVNNQVQTNLPWGRVTLVTSTFAGLSFLGVLSGKSLTAAISEKKGKVKDGYNY